MAVTGVSRIQVIGLYRRLLRKGGEFTDFNFRSYSLRRVRDYFREKKTLTDPQLIYKEYVFGVQQLEMLRRQTSLSQMYTHPKLVVETL